MMALTVYSVQASLALSDFPIFLFSISYFPFFLFLVLSSPAAAPEFIPSRPFPLFFSPLSFPLSFPLSLFSLPFLFLVPPRPRRILFPHGPFPSFFLPSLFPLSFPLSYPQTSAAGPGFIPSNLNFCLSLRTGSFYPLIKSQIGI